MSAEMDELLEYVEIPDIKSAVEIESSTMPYN
jgi:hypothetical protein